MNKPAARKSQRSSSPAETNPLPAVAAWQQAFHTGLRLNAEVASFLRHRISEDMTLPGRLASSRSPEEFSDSYNEFFQTATHDYFNEMEKLSAMLAESTVAAPAGFALFGAPFAQPVKAD